MRHSRLRRREHHRAGERLPVLHRGRGFRADDAGAARSRAAARAHPDRNLRPRAAETAAEGVRLAGDPLARDGGWRDRGGRWPGGRRRPLRRRSRRRSRRSARRMPSVDHDNPLAEVYEDQLFAADLVVLNKTDLLDDAGARAARPRSPHCCRARSRWCAAREGKLDPAVLLGLGAAAEDDLAARPSHHDALDGAHEHDDFESFVVPLAEIDDPAALLARLQRAAELRTACCASRDSPRCAARRCGWRSRASARGSASITTARGRRATARAGHVVVIGQTGLDRDGIGAAIRGLIRCTCWSAKPARWTTTEAAVDLGHAPADIVFLSFSDSDLGAAAAAWQAMPAPKPTLRLANLARLRHPMSVDRYVEQVIAHARCVIVRLLGGLDYWRYGCDELFSVCRERGIALALLPGDARDDARLAALSTVDGGVLARLDAYLREGGPDNVARALRYAAHLGGLADDSGAAGDRRSRLRRACVRRRADRCRSARRRSCSIARICWPAIWHRSRRWPQALDGARPRRARDLRRQPQGRRHRRLRCRHAARLAPGGGAERDRVLGAARRRRGIAAGRGRRAGAATACWRAARARRGRRRRAASSPADLAMQVVLPELDGRLPPRAIGFKAEQAPLPGLDFARTVLEPDADGIALAADRAAGWARLAATPRAARRLAIVLSDYPGAGGGQVGARGRAGHVREPRRHPAAAARGRLRDAPPIDPSALAQAAPAAFLTVAQYRNLLSELAGGVSRARSLRPGARRRTIPRCATARSRCRSCAPGNVILAVQPDRGCAPRPPRRLPRSGHAAAPRLCRLPSLAAPRRGDRRAGASRHARHAGMAAGQGGGAVRVAARRARCCAGCR